MSVMENQECFECVICLEEIAQTKRVITPCGHHFCFQCISHSMLTNTANTCPYCRTNLVENLPEEDEDDDSEYEDEDDDSEDDDSEDDDVAEDGENESYYGNSAEVTRRFVEGGYTMIDAVSMLTGQFDRRDPRYTKAFINKMCDEFNDIIQSVDDAHWEKEKEKTERDQFALEDLRTTSE